MPRKPDHDLAPFREWLEEDRLVTPVTSRSYSAVVSAILTSLDDDLSQESIDLAFAPRVGQSSYANYKTGWKAFTEFAFEKGATVPMPTKPKKVKSEAAPIPEEGLKVAASLREQKMAPASLRALNWHHVQSARVDTSCYEVVDPYRPAAFVLVPKLILDPWKELRATEGGEDLPLFSEMRGARMRYPTKHLMRQVKAFRGLAVTTKKTRAKTPQRSTGAAVSIEELRAAHVARLALSDPGLLSGSDRAALSLSGDRFAADPEKEQAVDEVRTTADLAALLSASTGPTQQHATGNPGSGSPASVPQGPLLGACVGLGGSARPLVREFDDGLPGYGMIAVGDDELGVAVDPNGCVTCGYARSVHAEAHGLSDGTISNCAVENGYDEDTCQMCANGCYGRHRFKRKGMP
jgi:hypothetical protein